MNISHYFAPEREFQLNSLTYSILEMPSNDIVVNMTVNDDVTSKVLDDTLLVSFTRTINCDPMFVDISIKFNLRLKIMAEPSDQPNWEQLDLYSCEDLRDLLFCVTSRASIAISNITAYLPTPIVTQPALLDPKGVG